MDIIVSKLLRYIFDHSDKKTMNQANILRNIEDKILIYDKPPYHQLTVIFYPDKENEAYVMLFQLDQFKMYFRSDCSCDTTKSKNLCPHQLAALLVIIDDVKSKTVKTISPITKTKKKKASRKDVSLGLELGSIDEILETKRFKLTRPPEIVQWWNKLSIELVEYCNTEITYEVNKHNSNYYEEVIKTVKFYQTKDNVLKVSCSCAQRILGTCEHINEVLNFLETNSVSVIAYLDTERLEIIKKNYAKQVDIPLNKLNDYFRIDLIENNLVFVPTAKAKGYFPPSNPSYYKTVTDLKYDAESINYPDFPEVGEKQKDFEAGFVLSLIYQNNLGQHHSKYIPIIGVGSSNSFLKYIKNFHNRKLSDHLYLTKNQEDILREINSYNTQVGYSQYEDESINKYIYFKNKTIFSYLLKEANVYLALKNSYSPTDNVKKSQLTNVSIDMTPLKLTFVLRENEYFYFLEAFLVSDDKSVHINLSTQYKKSILPYGVIYWKGKLYLLSNPQEAEFIKDLFVHEGVFSTTKTNYDSFYRDIILPISKRFPVTFKIKNHKSKTIHLQAEAKKIYLSEEANYMVFKPFVSYNNDIETALNTNIILKKNGETQLSFLRDEYFESQFQEEILALHDDFKESGPNPYYYLPVRILLKDTNFIDIIEKMRKSGIEIYGINELKKIKVSPYRATVSTGIKSGQDWFDISIQLKYGDYVVSLSEIRKAILRKDKYVKLSGGQLGLLPEEWIERFQKIFRFGTIDENGVQVSKMKFSVIDEMFEEISDFDILKELSDKKKKLKSFKSIKKIKIPKEITATLRDYQKEGFNWLNFLDEFKWGGILADDMGLGKTIQIISFLQRQIKKNKLINLVVLPTSLLYNWENEINKFAPKMKAVFYYGPKRDISKINLKTNHVLITSYGTMSNDIEILRALDFNYIILDESQAIKNPNSQRYKAACLLQSSNKIAMTGTPIENNTFDLYAQMNFLNPGFLGSPANFKDMYSKPIDQDGNQEVAKELQRMINPFLLRRTKDVVAKELPPKIEDVIYCEMPKAQRKVYDAYRNKYRDLLMNKIEQDGMGKSKIYILEGLTKLRQICDSPLLLSDEDNYGDRSVKIDILMEHIKEKTSKHKILVFSQFVKMLKLIQKELDVNGINYEYLDGQCNNKKRQKSVDNFQENKEVKVFLISLKAGGVGLNLTAADYVYLVDPWWNPAVENQAIDRCHRIGQDKHIIAYRMICKDTVEEKILDLQKKKLKIAKDIINVEDSFIKKIDMADINSIFG